MSWPTWLYRLSDPRDRWTGIDKEAHFFGAGLCYALADARQWPAVLVTAAAILLVEAIEGARWQRLTPLRRGMVENGIVRWPFFTDRVSLKDIVVGILGAVVTALVLP